jgi:hypothetical protein
MGLVEAATYRVDTVYGVRSENAVKGLNDVEHAAHSAHSATSGLSHALAAVGIGIGIHEAKHALIGFNEEVQNAKISLSAMLGAGYGVSWEQASAGADKLYGRYQRISQQLPITTQELTEFGNAITIATIQTGGGLGDIERIATKGSLAAKVFGKETKETAFAITEMLQGNARKQNSTVQLILGLAHTEAKAFNALSPEKRRAMVESVLESPAMQSAQAAFTGSFSGVVSTLEDRLQLFFGKVGLPLFKAITAEVQSWNEWLEKNSLKVDAFAKEVGEKLVDGFKTIKSVFEFLYNHADTLVAIAKAYAAIKIGSMLGNLGQGMANSVAAAASSGGGAAGLGSIGPATTALAVGYAIGTYINEQSGLSDSIAGVVRVNGELLDKTDKVTAAYAKTVRQMEELDESVAEASKKLNELAGKSAGGSQAAANLAGAEDYARQMVNHYNDAFRAGKSTEGIIDEDFMKRATREVTAAVASGQFGELKQVAGPGGNINYLQTQDERFKMYEGSGNLAGAGMQTILTAYAELLQSRNVGAQTETNALFYAALSQMPQGQRDMVDQEKALQATMSEAVRLLAEGKYLSMADVMKIIAGPDAKNPFKAQAVNHQTINNTIHVEVSAKDPDRWMAELDAKVSRKMRAPTQAKGAVYTRGGL